MKNKSNAYSTSHGKLIDP